MGNNTSGPPRKRGLTITKEFQSVFSTKPEGQRRRKSNGKTYRRKNSGTSSRSPTRNEYPTENGNIELSIGLPPRPLIRPNDAAFLLSPTPSSGICDDTVKSMDSRNSSELTNDRSEYDFDLTEGQNRRNLMAEAEFECTEIGEYLFVGGNKVATDWDMLQERNITRIVNCSASVVECVFVEEPNMTYLNLNMVDGKQDDISWFVCEVINFIYSGYLLNEKTLLHCEKGISRSCSFAIAYGMWYAGCGFQPSFQFVKARRKVCAPNSAFTCNLVEIDKLMNGDDQYIPIMFRCASHLGHDSHTPVLKVLRDQNSRKLITPNTSLLDPLGVFVLRTPENKENVEPIIYVWKGADASEETFEIAKRLAGYMRGVISSAEKLVFIREGEETPDFYYYLEKDGAFNRQTSRTFDDLFDQNKFNEPDETFVFLTVPERSMRASHSNTEDVVSSKSRILPYFQNSPGGGSRSVGGTSAKGSGTGFSLLNSLSFSQVSQKNTTTSSSVNVSRCSSAADETLSVTSKNKETKATELAIRGLTLQIPPIGTSAMDSISPPAMSSGHSYHSGGRNKNLSIRVSSIPKSAAFQPSPLSTLLPPGSLSSASSRSSVKSPEQLDQQMWRSKAFTLDIPQKKPSPLKDFIKAISQARSPARTVPPTPSADPIALPGNLESNTIFAYPSFGTGSESPLTQRPSPSHSPFRVTDPMEPSYPTSRSFSDDHRVASRTSDLSMFNIPTGRTNSSNLSVSNAVYALDTVRMADGSPRPFVQTTSRSDDMQPINSARSRTSVQPLTLTSRMVKGSNRLPDDVSLLRGPTPIEELKPVVTGEISSRDVTSAIAPTSAYSPYIFTPRINIPSASSSSVNLLNRVDSQVSANMSVRSTSGVLPSPFGSALRRSREVVRQQSTSAYANITAFSAPSTPIVPSLGSISNIGFATLPSVVSSAPMKPRLFMAVSEDDRHYSWDCMGVYDDNDLYDVSTSVLITVY